MNRKKLLAIVTAVALMALQMPAVFAAPVEGVGTVDYIDPSSGAYIDTIVPTSAELAFSLDPQNLAGIQGVGQWDPSAGGSIIPAGVDLAANKSAVPVKLTANIKLLDTAISPAVLTSDDTTVNSDTAKNMYLSFVPSKTKAEITQPAINAIAAPVYVQDSSVDQTFTKAALDAAGVDSTDELASTDAATALFGQYVETGAGTGVYNQVEVPAHPKISATTDTAISLFTPMADTDDAVVMTDVNAGADLAFVMDKAEYHVVKDSTGLKLAYGGTTASNDNYDTAAFVVGGLINKNADWSEYTGVSAKTISLSATYTFTTLTDAQYDAYTGSPTQIVGSTYNSIATTPPAPTTYAVTVTNDTHGTGSADVTPAAADATVTLTATPASGYQFDKWVAVDPASLTFTGNTFTMPAQAVTVEATFKPLYASAGFIVSGSTVTTLATALTDSKASSTDISIPFYFNGKTITSIVMGGSWTIPTAEYTLDATNNALIMKKSGTGSSTFTLNTASTGTKSLVITLSDSTTYTFSITVGA